MANLLVVEDSPTVGRLLLHQLTASGHSALHALSIAEALAVLGHPDLEFDLLLVDLVLPDGSGARLGQHCRELGCDVPIVFITGWPELPPALADVEEWRILNKPFARADLVAVVQRALEQSGKVNSPRPLSASAPSPPPPPAPGPPAAVTDAPRPRR